MTKLVGVRPPDPGGAIRVAVDGTDVAIFNVSGTLYGLSAHCSHVGGPLDRGHVEALTVTCPLHGSKFDLSSGLVLRGPAARPVRSYTVRGEPDGLIVEPKG